MPHVGTLDVDLGLDAEALGDGEYADLVEELMGHGYYQSEATKDFQLIREVPAGEGEEPIKVIVDFLMPRDARIKSIDLCSLRISEYCGPTGLISPLTSIH